MRYIIKALKALRNGLRGLFLWIEDLMKHKTDRIVMAIFIGLIVYHVFFLTGEGTLLIRDVANYTIAIAYVQLHYRFGRREQELEKQGKNQYMLMEQKVRNSSAIKLLTQEISSLRNEVKNLKEIIEKKDRHLEKNSRYIVHLETRLEILEKKAKNNE